MQKGSFYIHAQDFLLFRKTTDEVSVITRQISKIIFKKHINSFLDIGSGSGELTKTIVKKFKIKNTIAIDRHNFDKKWFKNIIFIKTDWLKFIYPKKFDFILSAHSMGYLSFKQAEKGIRKIYDYLDENGCAVIIVYDNQGNWPDFKKIFYPKNKLKNITVDYIEQIISKYNFREKIFFTKIYAKNIKQMLQISRFLGEKYISSYLKENKKISIFLQKFQKGNKTIVFPLKHRLFILYKNKKFLNNFSFSSFTNRPQKGAGKWKTHDFSLLW